MSASGEHVLALDVGTSTIKVGAFRLDGTPAAVSRREHDFALVGERAEQSVEHTWSLLCDATREVVAELGSPDVAAIALSTHRGTVVPIGSDGAALSEYILWMDRRGVPSAAWLEDAVGRTNYYDTCGHPIVPYTGISKLLWLQHETPAVFEAAASVGSPQTLLLRRLGCAENVSDRSAGTFLFPFDIEARTWSRSLAALIGFPLEKLPRLVDATDVVGRLSVSAASALGLSRGIPLVPGGGDGQCAGAGSGITRLGLAMVNVGTASGVQTFLPQPQLDPGRTLNCAAHVVTGAWELESHTQASGAVLRWLRNEFSPWSS